MISKSCAQGIVAMLAGASLTVIVAQTGPISCHAALDEAARAPLQ